MRGRKTVPPALLHEQPVKPEGAFLRLTRRNRPSWGFLRCSGSRSGQHGVRPIESQSERLRPDASNGYLPFFSPKESGLSRPVPAAAAAFGFACLGFLTSLFPRLLLPFPITTSPD
jgi:hypothetical protein